MNLIELVASSHVTEALGWTLLHFLWQGTLLAAALAVALPFMRSCAASSRYLACCAIMVLMMAAPAVTFVLVLRNLASSIDLAGLDLSLLDLNSLPFWHKLAPAMPALALCWLLGVWIFQTRLILQWSRAQHLKHCGTMTAPRLWAESVAELSARMNIVRPVHIFESTLAQVPMVMGWLRPVILVPASALTGLTPQQLRMVIAHELAHVARHDYLVNLIQAVFESLFFYHPAVWWMSRRIRIEREYCCDDMAVAVSGDALCYAKALSSLDALRDNEYQTALASNGGPLMNRIFRIVGINMGPSRRTGGWLAPAVLAASVITAATALTFTTAVRAGEHAPPAKIKVIEEVDVVAIAKKMKFERADVLASLREAGLDNNALLIVMQELGAEKEVFRAIKTAATKVGKKEKEHALKEKALIEKMKQKGMSKEEIKKALHEMSLKKKQTKELDKKKQAISKNELVEKLRKKGLTDDEIKKYLKEMSLKKEQTQLSKKKSIKVEKELVMKLRKKGLTDDEIKKYLHKMDDEKKGKAGKDLKKAGEYDELIKKMKAAGMSTKEIKAVIKAMDKRKKAEAGTI